MSRRPPRSTLLPYPALFRSTDDLLDVEGTDAAAGKRVGKDARSEEHTSELQSRVDISYAVFCLKKKLTFNTVYSKAILGGVIETAVADWATKLAWVDYAFDELKSSFFKMSSAHPVLNLSPRVTFSY